MARTYEAMLKSGMTGPSPSTEGNPDSPVHAAADPLHRKMEHDVRQLLERLRAIQQETGLKTFLFCGYGHGAGCSTLSRNLARLIAAEDPQSRTLHLDCSFGHPPAPLEGEYDMDLIRMLAAPPPYTPGILPRDDGPLHAITAQETDADSLRRIFSDRFRSFLDMAEGMYDWIIIDGPSANLSSHTLRLARYTGGMVLVLPQGRVKWEALNALRRNLNEQSIPVLGAVMTFRRYYIPAFLYKLL